MFINKLTKRCLEILDHQTSTLLKIYQCLYIINVFLRLLPHSTLNIQCERFFKHEIVISANLPEGR